MALENIKNENSLHANGERDVRLIELRFETQSVRRNKYPLLKAGNAHSFIYTLTPLYL